VTVLKTKRLNARPISKEDFPFLMAIHSDPEIAKMMAGTRTKEQVEKYLEQNVDEWNRSGFGTFIFFTPEGEFVGRAGLRALEIDGEAVVELMYGLMPAFWNRGYATEMAQACVKYAFDETTLTELVCFTLHENKASQRIMEKLGFVYEKEITHATLPHLFYRLRKPA